MQVLVYLAWMAAGLALSAGIAGFEVRREVLHFPVKEKFDRTAIFSISLAIASILGLVGGAIAASGGGLLAFLCFTLVTTLVVFVIYRVANFGKWLNRSVEEHPLSDLGSRRK